MIQFYTGRSGVGQSEPSTVHSYMQYLRQDNNDFFLNCSENYFVKKWATHLQFCVQIFALAFQNVFRAVRKIPELENKTTPKKCNIHTEMSA